MQYRFDNISYHHHHIQKNHKTQNIQYILHYRSHIPHHSNKSKRDTGTNGDKFKINRIFRGVLCYYGGYYMLVAEELSLHTYDCVGCCVYCTVRGGYCSQWEF